MLEHAFLPNKVPHVLAARGEQEQVSGVQDRCPDRANMSERWNVVVCKWFSQPKLLSNNRVAEVLNSPGQHKKPEEVCKAQSTTSAMWHTDTPHSSSDSSPDSSSDSSAVRSHWISGVACECVAGVH